MKAIKQHPRQQATPPSNGKAASAWDRIVPVAENPRHHLRVNIYGMNGTGKTTFACTFPKPLLLIGLEDGTDSIRESKELAPGVDFVMAYATKDLGEFRDGVANRRPSKTGKPYESVVIDTATSLQGLVLKEILGLESMPLQLGWGTVKREQYYDRSAVTKELLNLFLDRRVPAHVVVLAQQKDHTRKEEDGSGPYVDADLIQPFIASSLGQSPCAFLHESVDYILQTFVRERKIVEDYAQTINGKVEKKQRVKKTGEIEFVLRTAPAHPVYAAKVRKDKAVKMPDEIVDPNYEKFARAIRGEKV